MGEAISVTIDKEAVQARIVQAIIDSAIGDKIQSAIDAALVKPEGYGKTTLLENAVANVVSTEVRNEITKMLTDGGEFHARVRKIASELITDEAISKIVRRAYDR